MSQQRTLKGNWFGMRCSCVPFGLTFVEERIAGEVRETPHFLRLECRSTPILDRCRLRGGWAKPSWNIGIYPNI